MKENSNNNFFDTKVKKNLENKTNKSYSELERWAIDLKRKITNGQKELYPNPSSYDSFYLLYIFRFKDELEELWSKYYIFADKSFKLRMLESKEKFMQYLWEIYLTIYLSDIPGIKIIRSKRDKGPDIKAIYNNQIYYIECITPTQGLKYDKRGDIKGNYLPSMKMNTTGPIPIEEFKIRLRYALEEKGRKYNEYIKKHAVNMEDNLGIAISTSGLSQYGELMDFDKPTIIEVCKEINFFEKYPFIDFVIYSHKSIFDYNQISIKILKNLIIR